MAHLDPRRLAATPSIEVVIPAKIAFDFDSLVKVQNRLGHPGCYSGADIRFILEREFYADVEGNINVRQFGA
jgi:hypothetical protein